MRIRNGDEVAIFNNPITSRGIEGAAIVLECYGYKHPRDEHVRLYKITFVNSNSVADRWIKDIN